MMIKINPVILAGGVGSRLWPVSRKSLPKQLSNLVGNKSLLQECVLRFRDTQSIRFENTIILTNDDYRFIVRDQLEKLGFVKPNIIIEPVAKNTAPSVLAACLFQKKYGICSLMLVTPSDHFIDGLEKFYECIHAASEKAIKGDIMTFAVKPTRAETGYGYIEFDEKEADKVKRFIEKPSISVAENLIRSSKNFWNSGIFLFDIETMISAFKSFEPEMFEYVTKAVNSLEKDLGFWRISKESWENCREISFDYAILERAKNVGAVKLETKWTDLGDWKSIWEIKKSSSDSVVSVGNVTNIDCENVLLFSQESSQILVGIGLKNLIAVSTPDAVLVVSKENVQDVKTAVDNLKKSGFLQAEQFLKDYRPWGWFQVLSDSSDYKVKKIFIKPNSELSLQSHKHRSEHWVIVQGTALVTIEDKQFSLEKNQSIFVPKGKIHRIKNINNDPVIIIEVQTGSYLGEDDIVRYEDKYSRN